jgi:hypothetical protein
MVVPDLALICEIMLMAEGFQMSKILSRKFVILYKLCEDLLSKSRHYDWKLRAIKTTLWVPPHPNHPNHSAPTPSLRGPSSSSVWTLLVSLCLQPPTRTFPFLPPASPS